MPSTRTIANASQSVAIKWRPTLQRVVREAFDRYQSISLYFLFGSSVAWKLEGGWSGFRINEPSKATEPCGEVHYHGVMRWHIHVCCCINWCTSLHQHRARLPVRTRHVFCSAFPIQTRAARTPARGTSTGKKLRSTGRQVNGREATDRGCIAYPR